MLIMDLYWGFYTRRKTYTNKEVSAYYKAQLVVEWQI